mgnify:CR=1 FL=1
MEELMNELEETLPRVMAMEQEMIGIGSETIMQAALCMLVDAVAKKIRKTR